MGNGGRHTKMEEKKKLKTCYTQLGEEKGGGFEFYQKIRDWGKCERKGRTK